MSDPKSPNVGNSLNDLIYAVTKQYPSLLSVINAGIGPTAQSQLAADQAVSGGYAQLGTDIYKNFAPELNRVGSDITGANELAAARNDAATLAGPGRDVVQNADQLARIADPEFYQSRELGGNKLAELFGSLDLSPGLSGSERREVGSSLARDNSSRGLGDFPTSTSTVENAMRFGKAGEERMQKKQDKFGQALAQVTSFLPASKSGVDTFQQATGKAGMPNPAAGFIPKPTGDSGQNAFGLAQSVLGSGTQLQNTSMSNNANRRGAFEVTAGSLPDY